MNEILFNDYAKDPLKRGIEKVYKAVSITMGPFGRNVLIEKEYNQLSSTKDGVTVAKSVILNDVAENIGANVIKQAATKTVEMAGDGTTTATVLAYAIASKALESTVYSTVSVTEVKKGIEYAVEEVVKELKSMSQKVIDKNQLKQIATLSANGDEEIGNLVFTAMDKVGREGIVTVEKSNTGETRLDIVEGIQFDRGYKSPYFVTDNNTLTSVLNNPYILIYNGRIGAVKDLLPLLEKVSTENKSLLIIAEDIDGEALGTLVMNKARGVLQVCAVKAPEFGERRTHVLEDIAILTGATVLSNEKGMPLSRLNIEWLGQARLVTIGKDVTTIVDGKGNTDKIQERIISIKSLIDNTHTPYEIEKLQERLGKLTGGVAIINIGGNTDIEIDEKKDRVDDALQATKAALEEGLLPGAGIALIRAREVIKPNKLLLNKGNLAFEQGKKIVYDACLKPFEQLVSNAGNNINDYWNIISSKNGSTTLDINTNKAVNAYEEGIMDPTKVVRCALQNAAAAAITLLITECIIYKTPDKKDDSKSSGMSEFSF